jgi:hypothetical protein
MVEGTIEKRGLAFMASAGPIRCNLLGFLLFGYAGGRAQRGRDPALPGDRFQAGHRRVDHLEPAPLILTAT